jgi:hypothetical protein
MLPLSIEDRKLRGLGYFRLGLLLDLAGEVDQLVPSLLDVLELLLQTHQQLAILPFLVHILLLVPTYENLLLEHSPVIFRRGGACQVVE